MDRQTSGAQSNAAAATGFGNVLPVAQYVATPGSITANRYNHLLSDLKGSLRTTLMDFGGTTQLFPPTAALSDTLGNPTTTLVGAVGLAWDGTQMVRLRPGIAAGTNIGSAGVLAVSPALSTGSSSFSSQGAASNPSDANAGTQIAAMAGWAWNGATFDRSRGNTKETLLASAARTATTSTAVQTNYNARGVLVLLDITVASGTGGLQVRFWFSSSGVAQYANVAPTAITGATKRLYLLYPGVGAGSIDQQTSSALPREWGVDVVVGDASSYTYSLTAYPIL